jgi:hypothetical protein
VKDIATLATLVLAFATWVTVHVAIAARLLLRTTPRWRGFVALLMPPLAPVWAMRQGWRRPAVVWLASLALYVLARIAAIW